MKKAFIVFEPNGETRRIELHGRNAWALSELIEAGAGGCTPITHPGPRWSAYVHRLRHDYGLTIETIHETHKGRFPGNHARYVLRSRCQVLSGSSEAA